MFLKEKYDAFQNFKWYLARVEKEIGKSLKCLRSDRGGEFIYEEFNTFCNDKGIKRHMLAPRTPPQKEQINHGLCKNNDDGKEYFTKLLERSCKY